MLGQGQQLSQALTLVVEAEQVGFCAAKAIKQSYLTEYVEAHFLHKVWYSFLTRDRADLIHLRRFRSQNQQSNVQEREPHRRLTVQVAVRRSAVEYLDQVQDL